MPTSHCNCPILSDGNFSCVTEPASVGWLDGLRIYVASAVYKPYRNLEEGDNQSLKIQVARPGIEPRTLAPQAKSLITQPQPLPRTSLGKR